MNMFKTGCEDNTAQLPECGPTPEREVCCPPNKAIGRPVCGVKFDVQGCRPDITNPCDCLECAPCFDDIPLTAEAKEAVVATLNAMLYAISPVDRCGCEIVEQVGFTVPLKPSQAVNENGEFLFTQTNINAVTGAITTEQVTSAVNPDTGMANKPYFDELCCNGVDNKNSPFINRGTSSIRYRGGNGPILFGGFTGGVDSREFHEKIGDLFCCVLEKLDTAPIMEVEMVEEPATPAT